MSAPQSPVFDKVLLRKAANRLRKGVVDDTTTELCDWLEALVATQTRKADQVDSRTAVREMFRACLDESGITSGKIAELGGPFNSDAEHFPEFEFEWLSLFPVEERDDVRVCNICDADHIEGEQYDAILSVSVMEHVSEPWKAAENMLRLLKPGGIIFHSAPFSYFYHGAPADFWRYTPDGFDALFPTLKPMRGEFYGGARRRDNRGSETNAVDRDGGADFAVDAMGGWRENWTTVWCGQKDAAYEVEQRNRARDQVVVDVMGALKRQGFSVRQAAQIAVQELPHMELDDTLSLQVKGNGGLGFDLEEDACVRLYREQKERGVPLSYNRFALFERLVHLRGSRPDAPPLPEPEPERRTSPVRRGVAKALKSVGLLDAVNRLR